jgi:gas vesicle protein
MEASGSRATDNLDSTARLMADALAKASNELEKLVNVFCDHLSAFNQELGKSFQDEWRAADDRMETRLRQTTEAIARDREDLLKKLAEYKQVEVQSIIDTGKEVRSNLAVKVDETASEFARTLQDKIKEIQEQLVGPQADAIAQYDLMRAELASKGEELLSMMAGKSNDLNESAAQAHHDLDTEAQQVLASALQAIDQHVTSAVESIRSSHQQFAANIEERQKSVPVALEQKKSEALDAVALEEAACTEKLEEASKLGARYADDLTSSFDVSMSDISSIMTTLYDARLKNLLAQARTEIVNSARKAEERIHSTRNDLQTTLKELQREFVEKFEELFKQFESTVSDEGKDNRARAAKDSRAREQLNALFRRLGQEMIDTAASAAGRVETDFQKSVGAFEKRIESARDSACESLEREFKLMQKELGRTKQDFDRQLADLQHELGRIEKDGQDSAEIVQTIRSATLEF